MITAFMEGVHSAKKRKGVLYNPYISGLLANSHHATLWNSGYIHQLEVEADVAFQKELEAYDPTNRS